MATTQIANTWKLFLAAVDDTKPAEATTTVVDEIYASNKFNTSGSEWFVGG